MEQTSDGPNWQTTYDIWIAALDNTYRELVETAAAFVPDLVGAALLFVLGWLLAIALRASILRLGAGIDRMFHVVRDRLGLTQIELRWPISRVLAYTIYWLVIVLFLAAVLARLRKDRRPGRSGFFVVDSDNHLLGWVDIQDLALAGPEDIVGDLERPVEAVVQPMATR